MATTLWLRSATPLRLYFKWQAMRAKSLTVAPQASALCRASLRRSWSHESRKASLSLLGPIGQ